MRNRWRKVSFWYHLVCPDRIILYWARDFFTGRHFCEKKPNKMWIYRRGWNWKMSYFCLQCKKILTRNSRSGGWDIFRMCNINMQCISLHRLEPTNSIIFQKKLSYRLVQELFRVAKTSAFRRNFSVLKSIKFSLTENINGSLFWFLQRQFCFDRWRYPVTCFNLSGKPAEFYWENKSQFYRKVWEKKVWGHVQKYGGNWLHWSFYTLRGFFQSLKSRGEVKCLCLTSEWVLEKSPEHVQQNF